MKLITKFKSKNFDSRRYNKVVYIIIHYTALTNCDEAIRYLCDNKNIVLGVTLGTGLGFGLVVKLVLSNHLR